MKKKMKHTITAGLALLICALFLVVCGCGTDKLTEAAIKDELLNSDGELEGTLTIEGGTAKNVTAFSYVVTDVNASKLASKSFMKEAIVTIMSNPGNATYGMLKAYKACGATMQVMMIFNDDDDFNAATFIEESLNIICDGQTATYGSWAISAVVDRSNDSITIRAERNGKNKTNGGTSRPDRVDDAATMAGTPETQKSNKND